MTPYAQVLYAALAVLKLTTLFCNDTQQLATDLCVGLFEVGHACSTLC